MSVVNDIKNLKIQGASEIAKAAVIDLNAYGRDLKSKDKKGFTLKLGKHADMLKGARPTEPALQNCVNTVMFKIKASKTDDLLKLMKELFLYCKEEVLRIKSYMHKIEEHGAKVVTAHSVVLTHCHSHNVVNMLLRHSQDIRGISLQRSLLPRVLILSLL